MKLHVLSVKDHSEEKSTASVVKGWKKAVPSAKKAVILILNDESMLLTSAISGDDDKLVKDV